MIWFGSFECLKINLIEIIPDISVFWEWKFSLSQLVSSKISIHLERHLENNRYCICRVYGEHIHEPDRFYSRRNHKSSHRQHFQELNFKLMDLSMPSMNIRRPLTSEKARFYFFVVFFELCDDIENNGFGLIWHQGIIYALKTLK